MKEDINDCHFYSDLVASSANRFLVASRNGSHASGTNVANYHHHHHHHHHSSCCMH